MRGRIPISVAKIIADQAPHLIFWVFGFGFIGAPFMGVMSQQHHLSNPPFFVQLVLKRNTSTFIPIKKPYRNAQQGLTNQSLTLVAGEGFEPSTFGL